MHALQNQSTLFYFENSVGRVAQEAEYIRLQWLTGPTTSGTVRTVLEQFLRAQAHAPATGPIRLLIDQRLAKPFSEADRDWLTHEWLPYCTQLMGFHHAAHIAAQNVFARLSSVPVLAKARSLQLNHQCFDEEATALAWLLRQP